MKIYTGEQPKNPCEGCNLNHSECEGRCLEQTVYSAQLSILNACVEVGDFLKDPCIGCGLYIKESNSEACKTRLMCNSYLRYADTKFIVDNLFDYLKVHKCLYENLTYMEFRNAVSQFIQEQIKKQGGKDGH